MKHLTSSFCLVSFLIRFFKLVIYNLSVDHSICRTVRVVLETVQVIPDVTFPRSAIPNLEHL